MAQRDELNTNKYPKEFQRFLKKEIEIIKKLVKKEDKVLDVGCGTGRAISKISPHVLKYIGIDIDEHYLSQAKAIAMKFKNVKIRKLDVENLTNSFNENEFDITFSLFDTISILNDFKKALKQIHYVTKDKILF